MPAKKASSKSTAPEIKPAPQLFVKAEKTAEAKKKDAQKGKEPWRHTLTSGKAHPDNKPPLQIVAEASPENKKKYEDSINAEREKQQVTTNWWDYEGGVPAEEPELKTPLKYGPADADPRVKAEVKEELQNEGKDKAKK